MSVNVLLDYLKKKKTPPTPFLPSKSMILRKLKIGIMQYDINCVWKGEAGIMPRITRWMDEKGKGDL
jgi:hypothetical protein